MLTLNCWGLKYVSKLRKERFRAIAEYLAQYPGSSYDVIFLQVVNNNALHDKCDKIISFPLNVKHNYLIISMNI